FCHYFPHFTALFATPENRHYLLSSPQQLSGNKTYQNHKSVHYSFKRIANKRMLLAECSANRMITNPVVRHFPLCVR
ncbi:hypothetical protein, partial [Escherichia coli]